MAEFWIIEPDSLPEDPEEVARICLEAAVDEELKSVGKLAVSQDGIDIVLTRAAQFFPHFKKWWAASGIEIIGVEVELRSFHTPERGGRVDFLVRLPDGRIAILDGKSHLMWGKSIQSQNAIPDLEKEIQNGWYAAMLQRGCTAFVGVPNSERHTPTAELKKRYKSLDLKMNIDAYGIIEYGQLIPFMRGAKSGQYRGDILYTAPLTNHQIRNADEVAKYYNGMKFVGASPKIRSYIGNGKYSCDQCFFAKTCWPTQKSPEPVEKVHDFLKGVK